VKLKARSKINLFLEVLSKRPDGYHDIDTVFQSIDFSDDLFFDKQAEGITLTVSRPEVPTGEQNLIHRAYLLLKKRHPRKVKGVRIHLEKRIPMGAGLGGGSADAAATLRALDRLFELDLPEHEMERLSQELGMDVPFCLKGGTALASGRGEHIVPVERKADFQVLIVHPGFSVSTREAYEALDAMEVWEKQGSGAAVKALEGKKVDDLWPALYNTFERFVFKRHPVLNELKETLLKGGCDAVLLTGSGAALCGYASWERDLKALTEGLKKTYPFVVLTRPVQAGAVFIDNAEYSAQDTSIRLRRRT
jgi:4-diphosphocytidyl-2-C-methyl-D-erythritol kinase